MQFGTVPVSRDIQPLEAENTAEDADHCLSYGTAQSRSTRQPCWIDKVRNQK
jgi:hypothetical protein